MFTLIDNLVKYSIKFATPFIFGAIILVILAGMWAYSIFWKYDPKTTNKIIGPELTNNAQISLSIFVIALLLVISVSIYGIFDKIKVSSTVEKYREVSINFGVTLLSKIMVF